jgi:hypothetical protein
MAKSLWNYTRQELLTECSKREIFFKEKPSQKDLVEAVQTWNAEHGQLDEVVELDEKNEIVSPEEKRKEEMVKVIFHSKDEQDLPYVPAGLNGRFFYFPRDIEISIPKAVLNSSIKDAVEVKLMPKVSKDGKIYYEEKRVTRFPYSLVG